MAATSELAIARRPDSLARLLVGLFKLRIGTIIAATAMAGAALQPGPALGSLPLAMLFTGVLLAAAAAGGFNQFHEADLDARMRRTRGRPFVTGRFAHRWPWLVVIGVMAIAGIGLVGHFTSALAALYTGLGAFTYGVVYTVSLKRRTAWNVVIGGAAGSFGLLAGAAAVGTPLAGEVWLLALIVFLWTPPHFWSLAIVCHEDYAAAGVPMLPVVVGDALAAQAVIAHAAALVGLSWLLLLGAPGWIYGLFAFSGGLHFVAASARLAKQPTRLNARRAFVASLAQYALLLAGLMLDAALLG
jgi:protoheme IX farnesyltransferase